MAIQEKLDGRDTLATAQPLALLVNAKVAAGAYTDALAINDEVVAVRTKLFPANNVEVLQALATWDTYCDNLDSLHKPSG